MARSNMPTSRVNVAVARPNSVERGHAPPIGFAAPFARGQWHRSLGHKSNKDETVAKLISFIK